MIYLDHNATTAMLPEVRDFILNFANYPLNPSSIHQSGRRSKAIMEQARDKIMEMLNLQISKYQITFTSSGTESNNLILSNFKEADIFISNIEHPSILEVKNYLPNVETIRVDSQGIVDLTDLEMKLAKSSNSQKLISIMLANNETGVIQPLEELSHLAKKYNSLVHSDITQTLGKIKLDIGKYNFDFMTLSSHKLGGGAGAAALVSNIIYPLKAMITGGGQERGIRSGTENILAIAAFGEASRLVKRDVERWHERMKKLQHRLENNLPNNLKIVANNVTRLPNTSLIIAEQFDAQALLIQFDLAGICISSGAACSSGKVKVSHVLEAMGIEENIAKSAIRVSLSPFTTEDEIDKFIEIANILYNKRKIA